MITLPPLKCPGCTETLSGVEVEEALRVGADGFDGCLRRCAACRIGASNAVDPERVTFIYADPIAAIPPPSRDGAKEALEGALNVRNRPSKWAKFGYVPTSEDAVTWVVLTYLLRTGRLLGTLTRLGLCSVNTQSHPRLLLWGVPIDDTNGKGAHLRGSLQAVCTALGEEPQSYSEPDVIVDLGNDGLVFIEVKHFSKNDIKNAVYRGWTEKMYLTPSPMRWNVGEVKTSGYYELARNWRLLNELAAGRSALLVNLGPPALFRGEEGKRLDAFVAALRTSDRCGFRKLTWSELLSDAARGAPGWFLDFCRQRRLPVADSGTT